MSVLLRSSVVWVTTSPFTNLFLDCHHKTPRRRDSPMSLCAAPKSKTYNTLEPPESPFPSSSPHLSQHFFDHQIRRWPSPCTVTPGNSAPAMQKTNSKK